MPGLLNTPKIRENALREGFLGAFFLPYTEVSNLFRDFYLDYLDSHFHADMDYLENTFAKFDIHRIFSETSTIGVFPFGYYGPVVEKHIEEHPFKITRYAWGRDYHRILTQKLKKVCQGIENYRVVCDTTPMNERYFANLAIEKAFIGKNGMLIHPEWGSYFLLSFVLFSQSSGTEPVGEKHPSFLSCGDCRKCIEACPGMALDGKGRLNAEKCFSYWSIENKEAGITLKAKKNSWVFGCDICQEVCPYNEDPPESNDEEFMPREVSIKIAEGVWNFPPEDLYGTSFQRQKQSGIRRNIEYRKSRLT